MQNIKHSGLIFYSDLYQRLFTGFIKLKHGKINQSPAPVPGSYELQVSQNLQEIIMTPQSTVIFTVCQRKIKICSVLICSFTVL